MVMTRASIANQVSKGKTKTRKKKKDTKKNEFSRKSSGVSRTKQRGKRK